MRLQPVARRGFLACAMFFLLWLARQALSGAFRQLSRSRTLGQKVETVAQLECGTPEFAGRAHLLPVAQMGPASPYPLEHLSRSRSWTLRSGLGSSHAAHSGTLRCDLSARGEPSYGPCVRPPDLYATRHMGSIAGCSLVDIMPRHHSRVQLLPGKISLSRRVLYS